MLAVPGRQHVVQDRRVRATGLEELGVQRVQDATWWQRAVGSNDGLRQHLAPVRTLQAGLRRRTPEQVGFDLLQVEDGDQIVNGARHGYGFWSCSRSARNCSNSAAISSAVGTGAALS